MRKVYRGLFVFIFAMALLSPAVIGMADDTTPGYRGIQEAFLREDFKSVESLSRGFVTQHPDAAELSRVEIWLALSLDRLERANEALDVLDVLKQSLDENDPLWAELLFWDAEVSRRSEKHMRAKLAYQRLLANFPKSDWKDRSQIGLGLVYLEIQAFRRGATQFRNIRRRLKGKPIARQARLLEGLCFLRLKDFDRAAKLLRPLTYKAPEADIAAQAAFYLGESLSGLERYEEAARAYQRAVVAEEVPQWREPSLFGLGWAYFRAGLCEQSVAAFKKYLVREAVEHHAEALFAQGSCLMKIGREDLAVKRFEQLITKEPYHELAIESGIVVAESYRRQQRLVSAKRLLHRLLRRDLTSSQRAQIQLRLGMISLDEGNTTLANTMFRLARATGEPEVKQAALSGSGDVYLFLGNLDKAAGFYERVTGTSYVTRWSAYATYQLGRVRLEQGAFTEAMDLFRQVIVHAVESELMEDARLGLALVLMYQDEQALAAAQLESIRKERPNSDLAARAGYYLALQAMGEDDWQRAERLCQEVVAKVPISEEAVEARLLQADLMAQRLSVSAGLTWLRRVYESGMVPRRHKGKVARHLGRFAKSLGEYAQAIRWYDEAARLLPALLGEVTYRIASCYEEAGDLELAISWYYMSQQNPWHARGKLAAGKLLERQGRLEAAKAVYKALTEESVPEAKVAEERLAALREEIDKG